MNYVVTARKWRPMVFEDIVGQSHVTTTLRNAIATQRLSHAYIFSGSRGCGKTTTARILARVINCLHPKNNDPDNTCELCKEMIEGRSVNVFEIDGASNRGIEEIRSLRESVRYAPAKGNFKVYIIDEVHMLTKEAFNALLKTLEEPPPHVLFIFATTEVHKVPLTILSRCQRFDFRRISAEEIIGRLQHIAKAEKIAIDQDSLMLIAKKGDGSMRDAQSIFDQIVSFCGTTIDHQQIVQILNLVDDAYYFRVTDLILKNDTKGMLTLAEEVINHGYDLREFLNGLNEHFRNLLVSLATGSANLIEASEEEKKRFVAAAKQFTENDLLRYIKLVGDTESSLRWSQQPRYKFEIVLLQLAKMERSVQIDNLLQQLDELKKKLNGSLAETKRQPQVTYTELQTETPIRGSVKASPPVLRADQVVSAAPVPPISEKNVEVSRQTQPAPVSLSLDTALQRWQSFVGEARKERIILGTMLSESSVVGIQENRLRVSCPDDFHLEELKRNRQYLTQLAEKVYGARVWLEASIADGNLPSPHQPVREQAKKTSSSKENQHPVLKALINEFGAEEIE